MERRARGSSWGGKGGRSRLTQCSIVEILVLMRIRSAYLNPHPKRKSTSRQELGTLCGRLHPGSKGDTTRALRVFPELVEFLPKCLNLVGLFLFQVGNGLGHDILVCKFRTL